MAEALFAVILMAFVVDFCCLRLSRANWRITELDTTAAALQGLRSLRAILTSVRRTSFVLSAML